MGQCQEKEEELRNLHQVLKQIKDTQGIKDSQIIKEGKESMEKQLALKET
jgi:hypothetical protein